MLYYIRQVQTFQHTCRGSLRWIRKEVINNYIKVKVLKCAKKNRVDPPHHARCINQTKARKPPLTKTHNRRNHVKAMANQLMIYSSYRQLGIAATTGQDLEAAPDIRSNDRDVTRELTNSD
jgi:hypothetical protein